jgi:hypothetical protein
MGSCFRKRRAHLTPGSHRQEPAASAQPEGSSIGHSGPADDELACNPPAPRARRRCC